MGILIPCLLMVYHCADCRHLGGRTVSRGLHRRWSSRCQSCCSSTSGSAVSTSERAGQLRERGVHSRTPSFPPDARDHLRLILGYCGPDRAVLAVFCVCGGVFVYKESHGGVAEIRTDSAVTSGSSWSAQPPASWILAAEQVPTARRRTWDLKAAGGVLRDQHRGIIVLGAIRGAPAVIICLPIFLPSRRNSA